MTPLFDARSNLLGWYDGENVFDLSMGWVAFSSSGHLFSAASLRWLGALREGSFQDRTGKPVAWLQGTSPTGGLAPLTPLTPLRPLTPLTPLRPLTPLTPLIPLTPLGGWSPHSWETWLVQ